MEEEEVDLLFKWNGGEYTVTVSPEHTVSDLKRRLGGALLSH